jgi:hypothetical protein
MSMLRQSVGALRMVLASVTLVAMIAAPLCGSLCAAGACAKAESQTGDCHDGGAMTKSGAQESNVSTAKNCNLSPFPAARLNENAKLLERPKQQTASLAQHQPSLTSALVEAAGPRRSWHANQGPFDADPGAFTTILRI